MHLSGSKNQVPKRFNFGDKDEQSHSDEKKSAIKLAVIKSDIIKEFSANEVVTDGGIYWILDGSLDHYSLNSCRSKMSLFTQMYRDSKIAELFSCGCTKFSYIIGFGIGPYFQSLLDQALKEAPYFVCSFDESYKGRRPYPIYHAKRHVFGSTHPCTPENIRCDQNIFCCKTSYIGPLQAE